MRCCSISTQWAPQQGQSCCSPLPLAAAAAAAACRLQGVGRLVLPLSPAQAEALAAVAVPAPYGKGTATLLDASVRSSLQLEPEQLTIANEDEWSGKVALAVKHAAEGLGLPPADVKVSKVADLKVVYCLQHGHCIGPAAAAGLTCLPSSLAHTCCMPPPSLCHSRAAADWCCWWLVLLVAGGCGGDRCRAAEYAAAASAAALACTMSNASMHSLPR